VAVGNRLRSNPATDEEDRNDETNESKGRSHQRRSWF
jgi:hypothetical protein